MNSSDFYKFPFGSNKELVLKKPPGTFTPTGTTSALVEAASNYLDKPRKTLDLGCGIGVAGLALHHLGLIEEPLYASDISKEAIEALKENARTYLCEMVPKYGSIFEPWNGEIFEVIINDISGVAKKVAEISPWFDGVDCESGEDGTELVGRTLREAPNHLTKGGLFFFPVISLSKVDKILSVARENFKTVALLSRREWPLPKEMMGHISLLECLREKNLIQYDTKFGMIICFTEIYVGYN